MQKYGKSRVKTCTFSSTDWVVKLQCYPLYKTIFLGYIMEQKTDINETENVIDDNLLGIILREMNKHQTQMSTSTFEVSLDNVLGEFESRKYNITTFLKKNFKENIHYILKPIEKSTDSPFRGGLNKIEYFLTRETYELVKTSFNMKHKYVPLYNGTTQVRTIMSLENQTIGFIQNTFLNILKMKRQYSIGSYRVDLCLIDYKIVIECDENGHKDRNIEEETTRHKFIENKGYTIIRYNPNAPDFDLSVVLQKINMHLFEDVDTDQDSNQTDIKSNEDGEIDQKSQTETDDTVSCDDEGHQLFIEQLKLHAQIREADVKLKQLENEDKQLEIEAKQFEILSQKFEGDNAGFIKALEVSRSKIQTIVQIPESEKEIKDMVIQENPNENPLDITMLKSTEEINVIQENHNYNPIDITMLKKPEYITDITEIIEATIIEDENNLKPELDNKILEIEEPVEDQESIEEHHNASSEESEISNDSIAPARKLLGPRVQIYDANDLTVIKKVFDGITEATREVSDSSFTAIKFAAKNRLVYLDHRWFLIDRKDPNPNMVRDIGETVTQRQRNTGLVAMLNMDKTIIEKVFGNQKEAAAEISQHPSAMSSACKYGSSLSGHYWSFWDDLGTSLQDEYKTSHTEALPHKLTAKRGVSVQQLHAITGELIETFESMTDVTKKMKMSPKTIKKVTTDHTIYNGFKWKIV